MIADDQLGGLSSLLRTFAFGREHEHHDALTSTNDRALAWLRDGAPHGALVTADAQTAGRGRAGRAWHSPARENLYASLVVRPGPVGAWFGALGLAVGVGLREGLLAFVPDVALKWPNDVLCGGRKIGGILCESRWSDAGPEVVIGFGIDVHTREFPPDLRDVATSLALARAPQGAPGRARVLAELLVALERSLAAFVQGGFPAIRERYEPHCVVLGRAIDIEDPRAPGTRVRAIVEALEDDGALRVRADGRSWRVDAADVWLAG